MFADGREVEAEKVKSSHLSKNGVDVESELET